jgi:hypothetical protein
VVVGYAEELAEMAAPAAVAFHSLVECGIGKSDILQNETSSFRHFQVLLVREFGKIRDIADIRKELCDIDSFSLISVSYQSKLPF